MTIYKSLQLLLRRLKIHPYKDYLVCKAFVAASEDPFVGTYQKGKDF
jgi:hypothetical protein